MKGVFIFLASLYRRLYCCRSNHPSMDQSTTDFAHHELCYLAMAVVMFVVHLILDQMEKVLERSRRKNRSASWALWLISNAMLWGATLMIVTLVVYNVWFFVVPLFKKMADSIA